MDAPYLVNKKIGCVQFSEVQLHGPRIRPIDLVHVNHRIALQIRVAVVQREFARAEAPYRDFALQLIAGAGRESFDGGFAWFPVLGEQCGNQVGQGFSSLRSMIALSRRRSGSIENGRVMP